MHESVDTKSFLDGLKGRNKVNANVNLTFFSGGFQAWGGFNTIDLNLRSNTNLTLPYELFEFMKAGQTSANTVYDMETTILSEYNPLFIRNLKHTILKIGNGFVTC